MKERNVYNNMKIIILSFFLMTVALLIAWGGTTLKKIHEIGGWLIISIAIMIAVIALLLFILSAYQIMKSTDNFLNSLFDINFATLLKRYH